MGELERVITSMKKVVEKLQAENESLKRSTASSRPAQGRTEEGKKCISLQEENNKLKVYIIIISPQAIVRNSNFDQSSFELCLSAVESYV